MGLIPSHAFSASIRRSYSGAYYTQHLAISCGGICAVDENRYRIGMRVGIMTLLTNAALAVGKATAATATGSSSLRADALHSAADCLSTGVVLVGLHISSRPSDPDHPYGHGKAEALASAILSLTLLAGAGWMTWQGAGQLMQPAPATPRSWAMAVAFASILVKEALYRHAHGAALRMESDLLDADAWHHRADAMSSAAALAGIAASRLGFPAGDPIAAILVSILVLRAAWLLLLSAAGTLMDSRPDEFADEASEIRRIAEAAPGIRAVDEVRMRKYGGHLVVDLQVSMDGALPVERAHETVHELEADIESRRCRICDVFVHINPARN